MIELLPEAMVGKGLHRECYIHPNNPNRCIKVVVNRGVEETKREQAYYRLLQKRDIDWDMLPQFYGVEATTLGPGATFDLVRDHDGEVGHTFEYYFDSIALSEQYYQGLLQALQELKSYLFSQNIITMSIKPKNIIYQKVDIHSGKAIIIDNIGNSDVIPICTYNRFFGQKKINRKWQKFRALLKRDYVNNPAVQRLVEQL